MLRRYPSDKALVLRPVHETRRESVVLVILRSGEDLRQGNPANFGVLKQTSRTPLEAAPTPSPLRRRGSWTLSNRVCLRSFGASLGPRPVHSVPVDRSCQSYVLLSLQAALDLEAAHPCLDKHGDVIYRHQVLRRKQVLVRVAQVNQIPIADKAVRQPAGLCALAPIRRTTAMSFRGKALPAVGNAHGSMHEGLKLNSRCSLGHCRDLLNTQLTAYNDPRGAQLLIGKASPSR
mmetsp:Transcript_30112/g.65712  ORF Transcript_30112/g.65712 Transcript_30112/m.65712 type:complete len:233 (-) Transcript_30112:854-1552(-)